MSVGLPAVGTLVYNGYAFDGADHVEVKTDLVTDEADRTVLYHQHTIRVRAVIAAQTTDAEMEAIRLTLGYQGGALRFVNRGFGNDIIVNDPGGLGVRDVRFGPKPRMISWNPIGSHNACQIEWEVVVCVPPPYCKRGGQPRWTGLMSLNYAMTFSIDRRGATTRTISGHYTIAQTRRRDKKVPDTADAYRGVVDPDPPSNPQLGFERTMNDWILSDDKSRMDFTIVDQQILSPNAYPEGVIAIRARHRVSQRRARGEYFKARNTISMEIERAATISGAQTWFIFLAIAGQRIKHARARGEALLIDELEAEEDIFGYQSTFRVGYRYLSCLKDLVEHSGLWLDVSGTDWSRWRLSLADTMFSQRGDAKLRHLPAHDAIFDLCDTPATLNFAQGEAPRERPYPYTELENQVPPKEKSWYDYKVDIMPYEHNPVTAHSISQIPDYAYAPDQSFTDSQDIDFGLPQGISSIIEATSTGVFGVRVVGRARRAGHKIPLPKLKALGYQTPIQVNKMAHLRTIGNFFGVPVWALDFVLDYIVPNSPGKITPLSKLDECVNGEKAN